MTAWTGTLPTILAGEIPSATKMASILDALAYALEARITVGEQIETTDSATYTAETALISVTFPEVINKRYRVVAAVNIGTTVAGDAGTFRIRETNVAGTEIGIAPNVSLPNAGVAGNRVNLQVDYVASATGSKTICFTGIRATGTGNHRREADVTRPATLLVDYIDG